MLGLGAGPSLGSDGEGVGVASTISGAEGGAASTLRVDAAVLVADGSMLLGMF